MQDSHSRATDVIYMGYSAVCGKILPSTTTLGGKLNTFSIRRNSRMIR